MKEIIILAFLSAQFVGIISPRVNSDFRPPGTVEIVDNFFYDEGEIRNSDWREYIFDLRDMHGEDSNIYLHALPDTQIWQVNESNKAVLKNTYFWHPSYNNHPVVGISHQQAKAYCAWRTKAVEKMMLGLNMEITKKFEYRLPTRTEWELVAGAGYSKSKLKQVQKHKNKYGENARFHNMRYKEESEDNNDESSPCPTINYLPNKFCIYNIYGNIAEMVSDPGIAMGGSYRHYYQDIVPTNKPVTYEGAQDWVGFRCVCEINAE